MACLQMEKIEELTLYVIESSNEIAELKDENDALKVKLKELEDKMDTIMNEIHQSK